MCKDGVYHLKSIQIGASSSNHYTEECLLTWERSADSFTFTYWDAGRPMLREPCARSFTVRKVDLQAIIWREELKIIAVRIPKAKYNIEITEYENDNIWNVQTMYQRLDSRQDVSRSTGFFSLTFAMNSR